MSTTKVVLMLTAAVVAGIVVAPYVAQMATLVYLKIAGG